MSLTVLGTVALDDIKTSSGDKRQLLGGSAAHFAMSARLFTKVFLVGVVGTDFPSRHIGLLKRKGVNVDSLLKREGKTFHWKGEYNPGDYNTAITHATELGVLSDYHPQVAVSQLNIPNIFLANLDPHVQMRFLRLMRNPQFVGLDSMNLWINIMRPAVLKIMKKANLFVLNDGEAKLLTGETNMIKAAKQLRAMGPELIVIKKGEHGVLFYCGRFMFGFPAYPIGHVVDPTGAVVAGESAGAIGFKGPKKATPFAATRVVESLVGKIQKVGLKDVNVFVKGVGSGREAAIRALAANGLEILSIKDITPVPHNGCRSPRPRRV